MQEAINNLVEDGVTVVASSVIKVNSQLLTPPTATMSLVLQHTTKEATLLSLTILVLLTLVMASDTEIDSDIYGVSSGTSGAAASVSA